MYQKLIIEGNTVYEIDEECLCQKKQGQKDTKPEDEKKHRKEKGGR